MFCMGHISPAWNMLEYIDLGNVHKNSTLAKTMQYDGYDKSDLVNSDHLNAWFIADHHTKTGIENADQDDRILGLVKKKYGVRSSK